MGSYEKDTKKKGQPDQNIGTYSPVLPVYQTQQVNEDVDFTDDDVAEAKVVVSEEIQKLFIQAESTSEPIPINIQNPSLEHKILFAVSKLVAQSHSKIVFPTKPQGGNGGSYAKPDVLIDFLHGTTENDGVQLTVHKVSQHKVIPKPNGWVEIFNKAQAIEHLIATVKGKPGAPESVYTFINKKGDVEFGGIDKNGVQIPLNQECINAMAPVVATMMQTVLGNACIYEHDASHTQDIPKLIEKVEAELSQTHTHDLENKENMSPISVGSVADLDKGNLMAELDGFMMLAHEKSKDKVIVKVENDNFIYQLEMRDKDGKLSVRTLSENNAPDKDVLSKLKDIVTHIMTLDSDGFSEFKLLVKGCTIDEATNLIAQDKKLTLDNTSPKAFIDIKTVFENKIAKQHESAADKVKDDALPPSPPKKNSIHRP